jgi:LysR family positive regulator for ilvC
MPRTEHIPLELLQTFIQIADHEGNATVAAEKLAISQPSISKRLAALRRATSDPDQQPWLLLKGKRWKVTPEGQRVRGVVADLVSLPQDGRESVSIACGQQAATGFLKTAVERFLKEQPHCRVRLSTPRGKARIEGVAGGQFDMAIVSDSPATIHRIAKMDLHIETLFEDQFVLAANPPAKAPWAKHWNDLPTDRPVTAKALLGLPFIIPEPDASRRQQFDDWMFQATGKLLDVILETGGWQTILDFASSGLGVGVVPKSSISALDNHRKGKLSQRSLDLNEFPPEAVRLIARKSHNGAEPEVVELARKLYEIVKCSIP